MKHKDVAALVAIAIFAAVLAFGISGKFFKSSSRDFKVPVVEEVNGTLPDVRNQSDYSAIFNENAIDPTQPVQIQGNNSAPFGGH